jgi:hypothetical protein
MPPLEAPAYASRSRRRRARGSDPLHQDGAGAPKAGEQLRRLRFRRCLDRPHDWLVVTGLGADAVGAAELALLDPPERDEPPLLELEEGVVDADLALEETDLTVEAGRETSCAKITPQARAKMESASAVTRLRISTLRRRRAWSRSATTRLRASRDFGTGEATGAEPELMTIGGGWTQNVRRSCERAERSSRATLRPTSHPQSARPRVTTRCTANTKKRLTSL